jgi:hypothetical protein
MIISETERSMAGTKPRQPSQPRNKCPEVQNELPRSGKPDNSDSEPTSAAGQSEIRLCASKLELDHQIEA